MAKRVSIYGLLAFYPIQFPEEIEIRVHAHDRENRNPLGWNVILEGHKTWKWARAFYLASEPEFDEMEKLLRAGQPAGLRIGDYRTSLSDDLVLPDGYERSINEE